MFLPPVVWYEYYCYITVLSGNTVYMDGAGAGAEIRDKGEAGVENK